MAHLVDSVSSAGLTAIVVAVAMLPAEHGREGAKPPALVGFALFALWILAVASRATPWLTWWSVAVGVAHLAIAALEARQAIAHPSDAGQAFC